MKAVVFDAPRKIRVCEVPTPSIGDREVLVKVQATGICAGDMYINLGKNPYVSYPIIGGHEIAGVVEQVGPAVTSVRRGDLVAVEPFLSCGRCYPCRMGKSNCCANLQIIGVHHAGGFAEYVKAPDDRLHRVPAGLSAEHASFAEPVAIAVHACRRGEVRAGELVLILGCGPIGLALIEVTKARGARPLAVDVDAARRNAAEKLGAETLPAGDDLLPALLARTDGEGAPVVIEATGNVRVMEQTVDLVAAGGRIVIVGLVNRGVGVTYPGLDFTRKEVTVLGSRTSTNCFPEALDLLATGILRLPHAACQREMWDAPQIFGELADRPGEILKTVLIPNRPLLS